MAVEEVSINPDERNRLYAERLIAGDYKEVLVVMHGKDNTLGYFYDGSATAAVGLARLAETCLLQDLSKEDEEDPAE